jgi:hypothetical protein
MTAALAAKVGRLLAEKRLLPVGAAAVYRVAGDTADYSVFVHADYSHCTCPANGDCSHLRAAVLLNDAIADDRRAQHIAKAAGA